MKAVILLKLSGELLALNGSFGGLIESIARQISFLTAHTKIAIVIGGGNIFRGSQSSQFSLEPSTGHTIGMLATTINALILHNVLKNHGMQSSILTSYTCSLVGTCVNQQEIDQQFRLNDIVIFAGGIGAPYVTTDTAAMIRALQCNAKEVWKITKVDGIYDSDPAVDQSAKRYQNVSYDEAIKKNLRILDSSALNLAQENKIVVRVFSMFENDSLVQAYSNPSYGSSLTDQ